jgi:two-component system, sensor histidine kinase RpfC
LPAAPNFDELRSAIRIGCSFSRHVRITDLDASSEVATYQPKRVLVADDNRTNRNVLAAILESAGHEVLMVTDGDEALEALEKGGIDILLLDINMPRLNGLDACSMWRQIEGGRQHLPIIGVTADATSETEQKCRNVGMDLRITKPVDAKLLLATIEQYCGSTAIAEEALSQALDDPDGVVVPFVGVRDQGDHVLDTVQIDYLKSIGDQSFFESMIEGFFEDVEQTIEPLRLSVQDNAVADFRFCAHALKSSGNNMGAKRLASLCSRMESVTEGDFDEHRDAYLKKVESELTAVMAALKSGETLTGQYSSTTLSRQQH